MRYINFTEAASCRVISDMRSVSNLTCEAYGRDKHQGPRFFLPSSIPFCTKRAADNTETIFQFLVNLTTLLINDQWPTMCVRVSVVSASLVKGPDVPHVGDNPRHEIVLCNGTYSYIYLTASSLVDDVHGKPPTYDYELAVDPYFSTYSSDQEMIAFTLTTAMVNFHIPTNRLYIPYDRDAARVDLYQLWLITFVVVMSLLWNLKRGEKKSDGNNIEPLIRT